MEASAEMGHYVADDIDRRSIGAIANIKENFKIQRILRRVHHWIDYAKSRDYHDFDYRGGVNGPDMTEVQARKVANLLRAKGYAADVVYKPFKGGDLYAIMVRWN